ncbi:PPE domain-containing protein [Mycobacterium sp. 155]|uniref:PPE domain-containing protein n=1 Tax=Mycobacterium sp. 155 TaxID=1157943 RepID=UPI000380D9B0|nr:PPE domain-containing protein [Mycobacterium sp. 155]
MPFGDAAASPPELNHALMAGGDDAATVMTAATGHQGLADMLQAEMAALLGNAGMTAASGWQGLGGTGMLGSAADYATVLELAFTWLQEAFAAATEAGTAHQTSLASMIPAPVCTTNLATQQALAATNFMGINTPAILQLAALYQGYWVQNASLMTSYQAVVEAALAALATPPPLSPSAADPAAPAAAAAASAAQSGTQGALQASAKSMTQTVDATGQGAKPAAALASSPMSAIGSMGSMLGQFSSLGSMGGQLPQLLTSAPSQLSGLFSPFSSMFTGMGGADLPGAMAPALPGAMTAGGSAASGLGGAASGLGAGGGGLGGLGSGVFTSGTASASLVRPASSFSPPSAPSLPGGWQGALPLAETAPVPSAGMGGGLYGAPASAVAREQHQQGGADRMPTRTMQVTARAGRGQRAEIGA